MSAEVHRYLRVIAKAAVCTKDQVADEFLRRVILKEYPFLEETHKSIEVLEKEMIEKVERKGAPK